MKLNAARADGASLCFRCAYSVLSIFGRVQPRVPQIAKENPDSQNSSPKKLLILEWCSFASSFCVVLLIDIYPAAAVRRLIQLLFNFFAIWCLCLV